MPHPSYGPLDDALERLAASGPELRSGLTSHAPMTVEALCALGRAEAVAPWLARYEAELLPAPAPRERVDAARWRSALGQPCRFADWARLFERELAEDDWPAVLERWAARLAPGIAADATHGVIRTGHAVRSLEDAVTPPRLRELAGGLASWAAGYQELPVSRERAETRGLSVAEALAEVPLQPPGERRFAGTIVSALEALRGTPAFARAIHLPALGGDPGERLAELTEAFARVLLANARDPLTAIVFVHGVTATAALGSLLPHLREETARAALRFAWQAACGLYAAFGSAPPAPRAASEPAAGRAFPPELVERAIAHGDEHAIKLAEASVRRHALAPSPVYAAALDRTLRLLPRA